MASRRGAMPEHPSLDAKAAKFQGRYGGIADFTKWGTVQEIDDMQASADVCYQMKCAETEWRDLDRKFKKADRKLAVLHAAWGDICKLRRGAMRNVHNRKAKAAKASFERCHWDWGVPITK